MSQLSEKNLHIQFNPRDLQAKDEFGKLNRSVKDVVETLSAIIGEIDHTVLALSVSSDTMKTNTIEVTDTMTHITETITDISEGALHQAHDTAQVVNDISILGDNIKANEQSAETLMAASYLCFILWVKKKN